MAADGFTKQLGADDKKALFECPLESLAFVSLAVSGWGVLGESDPLAAVWVRLLPLLESPLTSPSGWHCSSLKIQLQGPLL